MKNGKYMEFKQLFPALGESIKISRLQLARGDCSYEAANYAERSSGKLLRVFRRCRRHPSHRLSLRLKRRWRTCRRNAAEVCEIPAASGQEPLMKSYYRVLVKRRGPYLAHAERSGRERPPHFTRGGGRNSRHSYADSAESRGENKEYKLRALLTGAEAGRQLGRVRLERRNKRSRNPHAADEVGGIHVVWLGHVTAQLGRVTFGSNFRFRDPASCPLRV